MKKIIKLMSILLIAAMLFCFFGCPNANTPETPTNPTAAPVSGIFSEGNAFYMNVEADKAPANGNGAW